MSKDIFVVMKYGTSSIDGKDYSLIQGIFTTRAKAEKRKKLGLKFEDDPTATWVVVEYDLQ